MTLITSRLEVLRVAAMDPELVAAPEIAADRASLRVLAKEPVA
jgi:hypothetical protein